MPQDGSLNALSQAIVNGFRGRGLFGENRDKAKVRWGLAVSVREKCREFGVS